MMPLDRRELRRQYGAALKLYLADASESARAVGYDLGHRALAGGIGVLDLVTLYREVLPDALDRGNERELGRAAEFLAETLAPFEMALRGYAEANRALRTQNFELQRTKAAMEAAHEEIEAFSYSIAHDLRTPLRHIDGFSRLLESEAAGTDERGREHIGRIRGAVSRMAGLIDDLLELARVSRAPLRVQPVDLSKLAHDIAEDMARANQSRHVQVVIEAGLTARGDAPLLRCMLENLIGNAWKFTSKQPSPRIEVGREADGAEPAFFVRDNGAGFDPAYADRLFTPFQRLHRADEFPGTGIGLATVRRIVRRHNGKVWARAAVGAGATFFWTLGLPPQAEGAERYE